MIDGLEAGKIDLWAKYREGEWRLPKVGEPEPPPPVPIRDIFS